MTKMLSAIIIIIFNFLHILVNGSNIEFQSETHHQKQVQVQITDPQLPTQAGAQPQVGLHPQPHPRRKKKKHPKPQPQPQPQVGLHPQPHPRRKKNKHPKPQPQPQPQPQVQNPNNILPFPTLPTQPQPQPQAQNPDNLLPLPTPGQTQPQPLLQVPNPVPLLPIPTPVQTTPQLPFQQSTLQDMYNAMASSKPQAYLAAHNIFRGKMGVPPLQWDKKLEDYAFTYASKCAKDCRLQHSYGPYGENLFWELYEESTPDQIVKSFTDEQQNYDLQKGECKCQQETGKCMCGHFTAVIWKKTERMGCAEVRCEAEKGKLVVCSYDPPGNVIGQDPLHRQ